MSPPDTDAGAPGILYISYDGMLEPLGQSQVVAYLEKLAPGRRIHLVSFEKPRDWADEARKSAMRDRLGAGGIHWHPLRYHKSPTAPATAYDITVGSALAIYLTRRHRLDLVHARSYVAAAMVLAVRRLTGIPFLFDMRGFWADERVDGGLWPSGGQLYRTAKTLERKLLLTADHVVTLTNASAREIRRFDYLEGRVPPIAVIPACADLERFTIQGPPKRESFVLGYVGSVGTWYLLDGMLAFFRSLHAREPRARLLVVNRGEHDWVRERMRAASIDPPLVDITSADHGDMPRQVARMSAAMALVMPAWSKIASAPTKLGEYLGCGVPCLGNSGVGDMEEILESRKVGIALSGFDGDELAEGAARLLASARDPDIQSRCRKAALDLFSLDKGVEAYAAIYERLAPRSFQRAAR